MEAIRPPRLDVPGLRMLATYQPAWLPRDILAGLVLTAVLVPVGMGYAEAAGLPAITGLVLAMAVSNVLLSSWLERNPKTTNARAVVGGMLVFDTVYHPENTMFLKLAKERGATTVNGVDMFVGQAAEQFKLYTGREAPQDVMRATLKRKLGPIRE